MDQQSPFNPQLLLERLRLQQAGGAPQKRTTVSAANVVTGSVDKQKAVPSSSSSGNNNNNTPDDSYLSQQQPYVNPFRQKYDFEAPSIYGIQTENYNNNNNSQTDTFYNIFRNISHNLTGDKRSNPFTTSGASSSNAPAVSEADNGSAGSLLNETQPQYQETIEELNEKLQNKLLELSEDLKQSNQKNIELQIENESLEHRYMQLKFKTDDTIAELRGKIASYALGRIPNNNTNTNNNNNSTGYSKVFDVSDNDSAAYPSSYSGTDNSLNNSSYSEPTFSEIMRRTGRRDFVGDDYFNAILRKNTTHTGKGAPSRKQAARGGGGAAGPVSPQNTISTLNESVGSDSNSNSNSQSKNPFGASSINSSSDNKAVQKEIGAKSDVMIDIYPSLRLNESIAHVANSVGHIKDNKRSSVWSSDRRKSLNSWLTEDDEVVVDVDLTTELDT